MGIENNNVITKKEWQFVLFFSLLVMTITILPYLYGYWITPPEKQFMGTHAINSNDTYWYISLIEQAREGNILFTYLSYPEFPQRIIFHPLFLVMGWFAKIFNMPNIFVYHLFRVMLGFVFLWISYVFISHFLKDILKRKIAFVFLALGAGVGWFIKTIGRFEQLPSGDLWMKQINGFLTIYESPQNIMATILLMIIFLSFLFLLNSKMTKYAIMCGLGILLLFLIHPYEIMAVILILFFYFLYSAIAQKISLNFLYNKIVIIFLFLLIGAYYNYYAITNSPILAMWAKEHNLFNPQLSVYFSGLGFLFLFSLLAFYKIIKEKLSNFSLIILWVVVSFFLGYQPWIKGFQMELMGELFVPIAILAAEGIFVFLQYLKKYFSKTTAEGLILWIIVFTTLSNVAIIQRDVEYYKMKSWPFYLEKEYISAFDWIKNNAGRNETILTNRDLAYFIPGITGNPIFLSFNYAPEASYYKQKISELKWFFEAADNEAEKYKFLKDKNISYLLYAPESLKITDAHKKSEDYEIYYKNYYYDISNFNPEKIAGLKAVYQNSKAMIYKVE